MGRFRTFDRKKSKYHNHAVVIDGTRFASKGEAERYIELRDMKKRNEIKTFELQPEFILQPKFQKKDPTGKLITYQPIKYRADFRVTYLDGHQTIEDVKGRGGYTTPEFKNKKKTFEYIFPDLHLEVIQRSGKGIEIFDESNKVGSDVTETREEMRDVHERIPAHKDE
jgi:hypothetical protein